MGKYQQLADRIRALPDSGRVAIAVVSAQRLMNHHLSLPAMDRDPYIVDLAPDLDTLWRALSAPSTKADVALRKLLKKRRSEPYADQIGKSGGPRGDDHPFAAAMNALEAYCLGEPKFGVGAAMRLIDAASDMAGAISERLGEDLMSPKAKARSEALARPEFNRVTSALGVLEREGVSATSLHKLRKIFAGSGLGQSSSRERKGSVK
jgi:hypothetical protein